MEITNALGIAGAAIILILFVGNQLNRLKNDNFYYDLFNFIGSLLLLIYSINTNSLPFVILNFVWAAFSLKDVVQKLLSSKNIKLVVK